MGQLITITFCRGTFHYSVLLISAVSKKGLWLFPMKHFPYIFALFSTFYLFFFFCLLQWTAPALPSSWVLSPLAVPLVASAAPWLMWPVSDGKTSRAHPFFILKHSFSQQPLHSASLGWQPRANSVSVIYPSYPYKKRETLTPHFPETFKAVSHILKLLAFPPLPCSIRARYSICILK